MFQFDLANPIYNVCRCPQFFLNLKNEIHSNKEIIPHIQSLKKAICKREGVRDISNLNQLKSLHYFEEVIKRHDCIKSKDDPFPRRRSDLECKKVINLEADFLSLCKGKNYEELKKIFIQKITEPQSQSAAPAGKIHSND